MTGREFDDLINVRKIQELPKIPRYCSFCRKIMADMLDKEWEKEIVPINDYDTLLYAHVRCFKDMADHSRIDLGRKLELITSENNVLRRKLNDIHKILNEFFGNI